MFDVLFRVKIAIEAAGREEDGVKQMKRLQGEAAKSKLYM